MTSSPNPTPDPRYADRTALVTGATSGLGFEAADQLAAAGFGRVVVTGRSTDRAEAAAAELARRSGRDVFHPLAIDLNRPASVDAAAATIDADGIDVDYLLLNAGMVSGNTRMRTDAGVEVTFASSLIGHHQLTMRLLAAGRLTPTARIVISGSEAARDDVPTFSVIDLSELADAHYDGNTRAAAEDLIRGEQPGKFKPGDTYATAKAFVAMWSAALARRLPEGMTVNTVSPGSAPNTQAIRNANFFMRKVFVPVLKHAPKRFGMAASTPVAAARYLEPLGLRPDVSGEFFASAPKKMTGPLYRMDQPHLLDVDSQEAAWDATVGVAGIGVPAAA